MKKLKEEVTRLNENEEFIQFLDDETEERLLKNSYMQLGYEDGIKEGVEKGIEEKTLEIVKNLLKEKSDIVLIEKVTGLSKEEILKIKEEL